MREAIGNMYLHSKEELDKFNEAVRIANELYSKAEESGTEDINVTIEAGKTFKVNVSCNTKSEE